MEQYYLTVACIMAGIFGLCIGSWLNVVIYRLPNGMNMSFPGSHCTTCDYVLKWYDNIPVLSWLMLGGKCRKCKQPISPRYTIVELANMALWVLCVVLFWQKSIVYACLAAVTCSALICVFFIDLEHMLIYNRFVIIIAIAGIAAAFTDGFTTELDHLIGALAGGAVFAGVYYGSLAVLKKEGLGFGDVKLAAAAGLLLGWQKLLLAMLIASVSASVVLIIMRKFYDAEEGKEYPFGPFIAVGILLSMFFGNEIISWYFGLILG